MNHLVSDQIGLEKLNRSQLNIQTDFYILNTLRPFHKWEVEVEVLADNSLKCAHHFCCGQEPCLPFSFMVLLQLTR